MHIFWPECDGSPAINYKTDTGFSRIFNRHSTAKHMHSHMLTPHTCAYVSYITSEHMYAHTACICICAYINDKYFDRIWFLMRFCALSLHHFALLLFIWGISFRSPFGLHNLSTRIKSKNNKTDNRKQILMNILLLFFAII